MFNDEFVNLWSSFVKEFRKLVVGRVEASGLVFCHFIVIVVFRKYHRKMLALLLT